jgi:hypothetical protein
MTFWDHQHIRVVQQFDGPERPFASGQHGKGDIQLTGFHR